MTRHALRRRIKRQETFLQAVELLQVFDALLIRKRDQSAHAAVTASYRRLRRGRAALEKKIAAAWLSTKRSSVLS